MTSSDWMILAATMFVAYYLLIVRRRRVRVEPSPVEQLKASREARNSVDDVELRLLEFHREVEARTRNKIDMLQVLLDEVERKSAELRELLAKADRLRQDS